MQASIESKRIESVQAMRGIAALLVVLWHASNHFGPYGNGRIGAVLGPGATIGVSLFFVISGFIMVCVTQNSRGDLTDTAKFYSKRFARVWPTYAVATAITLMVIPPDPTQTIDRLILSLAFIPQPNWGYPSLNVGWTLNYEAYFYLVFGLSMLFGRWRWLAFFAWFFATTIILPRYTTMFITNYIIMYFILGAALGLAYLAFPSSFLAKALDRPLPRLLSPLLWLGGVSYSLYLFHPAAMAVYNALIGNPDGVRGFAISIALSIVVAGVAHRFIEIPTKNYFDPSGIDAFHKRELDNDSFGERTSGVVADIDGR